MEGDKRTEGPIIMTVKEVVDSLCEGDIYSLIDENDSVILNGACKTDDYSDYGLTEDILKLTVTCLHATTEAISEYCDEGDQITMLYIYVKEKLNEPPAA